MNASGIVNNSVVPTSRRPDGSIRKAIKIRPGFIPQEDQQPFVSSRMQETKQNIPGSSKKRDQQQPKSKAAIKNEKRKLKEQSKFVETEPSVPIKDQAEEQSEELANEKKIRGIQKKLRQIEVLEKKLANGEELLPEQSTKLLGKEELTKELLKLQIN